MASTIPRVSFSSSRVAVIGFGASGGGIGGLLAEIVLRACGAGDVGVVGSAEGGLARASSATRVSHRDAS